MFCWRCEEISLSLLRCNKPPLQPVLEDPAAVLSWWEAKDVVGKFFPFLTGACLMCAEPSPGCRDPGDYWDVGGHPSHVPGSTTSPDAHHASWFSSSVKEELHRAWPELQTAPKRRWAVVPSYSPGDWLFYTSLDHGCDIGSHASMWGTLSFWAEKDGGPWDLGITADLQLESACGSLHGNQSQGGPQQCRSWTKKTNQDKLGHSQNQNEGPWMSSIQGMWFPGRGIYQRSPVNISSAFVSLLEALLHHW